jgi:hypothetical protein
MRKERSEWFNLLNLSTTLITRLAISKLRILRGVRRYTEDCACFLNEEKYYYEIQAGFKRLRNTKKGGKKVVSNKLK